jgi:uncharacterized protein (TIGR02145 family)
MIFPFPYSKGSRGEVILGFSNIYAIDESSITSDFNASPVRAVFSPSINVNDIIDLGFNDSFRSFPAGYQYILFPKFPTYPKYHYQQDDVVGLENWFFITPLHSNQNYGMMYNWYAGATGYLAPTGWRVSSSGDWANLISACGGSTVAGNVLKGTNTVSNGHPFWSNSGGEDTYNFSAYPGGVRLNGTGEYNNLNFDGFWWTTSEIGSNGLIVNINSNSNSVTIGTDVSYAKSAGASVRCVRNTIGEESDYANGTYCAPVTDIDGNVYKTVKIGSFVWMTENLATTRGASNQIFNVNCSTFAWQTGSSLGAPSLCMYGKFVNPNSSTCWWVNDSEFSYDGKTYNLYKLKSLSYGSPRTEAPVNQKWSTTDLSNDLGEVGSTKDPIQENDSIPIPTEETP